MSKWAISGVTAITPDKVMDDVTLVVKNDKIDKIGKIASDSSKNTLTVEVSDAVVTPGLINGHDHILGTYYPRVGNGPYENWLPWDNDLKSSPVYEERQQIENRDLYLLGGYRNLVSGVTTVSDHIPHFVSEPYLDILPMKAIRNYALAHSIASFALAWGDGVDIEYKKALKEDMPFITHIAEGFDSETRADLQTLEKQGGFGDHSVLVHGIAFTKEDIVRIKQKNASVVWCADSNMFMFSKTAKIKTMLAKGVNLCIGTDSPMSGGLHLLHEMKYDKAYYKRKYRQELPDEMIVRMVTSNPAKAFRLKKNGYLKSDYTADFTVFAQRYEDPYSSVVHAELRDVLLVVIDGKPAYGSSEFSDLFDSLDIEYQEIVIDGVEKIIIGDLIGLLKRISKAVGFKKDLPFLPVEFDF